MNSTQKLEKLFEQTFVELNNSKDNNTATIEDQYNLIIQKLNESILNDPEFDDQYLLDSLKLKIDSYESDPKPEDWQWITSLISVIFQRQKLLDKLATLLSNHLTKNSNIDNEYISDWLISLDRSAVLQVFISHNLDHENHYLIEKIIRELAYHKQEIGDAILPLLNHSSGFVRDAVVDYLGKNNLSHYYESLYTMIQTEPDEDFRIILKGIKLLIRWNYNEEAKTAIKTYLHKINNYRKEYQEQTDVSDFKREIETIYTTILK